MTPLEQLLVDALLMASYVRCVSLVNCMGFVVPALKASIEVSSGSFDAIGSLVW